MKALRPLNRGAVRSANDDFYASHPEMIVSGIRQLINPADPKQAAMRKEWMDSYARHGGATEPTHGKLAADALRKVNSSLAKAAPSINRSAVLSCPYASNSVPVRIQPPPQPPRKPEALKPCKLVKLDLTCMHGRHAGPEGVLMVVPGLDKQSSLGDTITGKMTFEGGCGNHAAWSVGGYWATSGKGSNFNFGAHAASAHVTGFFSLKNVTPHSYRVEGESCVGGRTIDVRAYPAGKISGKIDIKELKDKIIDLLKNAPLEKEKRIKLESNFFHGAISYEGAWNEHTDWRAYYERSINGGFDPLMAGSVRGQVYPPSIIPAKVAKYVEAGLFLELEASASLMIAYTSTYWPDTGKSAASTWKASLEGGVEVTLSLEANLINKNVLIARVAGSTAGKITAERQIGGEPVVDFKGKWEGLVGKFTLLAAWGTIEINREYQLVGPREWSLGQWHVGEAESGSG